LIECGPHRRATSFVVLCRAATLKRFRRVRRLCVLVFTTRWNEFLLAPLLVSGSESHQLRRSALSVFRRPARSR